jgi:hypothetical protein
MVPSKLRMKLGCKMRVERANNEANRSGRSYTRVVVLLDSSEGVQAGEGCLCRKIWECLGVSL